MNFRANDDERPVKLENIVKGYFSNKKGFSFDLHLSYEIQPLIKKYSNNCPTLVNHFFLIFQINILFLKHFKLKEIFFLSTWKLFIL